MTSHVDTELLALSAEGLLTPAEESSVQEHLAGCEHCEEQIRALAAVSQTLGEAPTPALPDDVATRLEDAVRAEAERRHEQPPVPSPPPRSEEESGGVVPFHGRKGHRRWVPYLVAAAAAVFVIGGAGAVLQGMFYDGSTVETAPEVTQNDSPDAALAHSPLLLNSGTEYTEENLHSQAADVLSTVSPDALPGAPESDTEAPGAPSRPSPSEMPHNISSCVHKLAGADNEQQPVLIDMATFRSGESAAAEEAWVMYHESGPEDEFDVVVVSPRCADTDSADDTVLAETTLSAP